MLPIKLQYLCSDTIKLTSLQLVVTIIADISNFFLDNSPKREAFLNAIFKVFLSLKKCVSISI